MAKRRRWTVVFVPHGSEPSRIVEVSYGLIKLAVGGVASGEGWPVVDYITGGWIGGLVGGLQRLQTIGNEQTRIVASRGPVLSMAQVKTQADMYGTLYERLTQMLNKGRSPDEAVAAKPAKDYEAQMGNPDEFVRRSFESLWAYLSPDA